MNSNFIICVLFVHFLQWNAVESKKRIYLDYHYEMEGAVAKPVCINKDEYVVPEGEDVAIYVKKVEKIIFAHSRCTLQQNTSFVTANNFYICCGSSMFRIKLKHVISAPYNCSFYVPKEEGKAFEPTAVFNNITYVRLSWVFNLKVYREKPILLTTDIDGEVLTPSRKSIDNVVKSEYTYNKEQKLLVTCKKHENTKGIVELSIPESNGQSTDSKLLIFTTNLTISNPRVLGSYFSIKCMLRDHNDILEIYDIYFAPKRDPNEIDVEGLPLSNIIENEDDNKYMYYKYTDYELIYMKCSMVCPHELCSMGMSYNGKKVNNTQSMYNRRIDLIHSFLLTPAENSSVIECIAYHERKKGASRFKFIYITLLYVKEQLKQSTTTLPPNGCFDPSTGANVNCTISNTLPTILLANSSQSSTAHESSKSSIWLIAFEIILVQAVIVLIVCLACVCHRRSKQKLRCPQLPITESLELHTYPSASHNNEQEYEEIPETITRPVIPELRQLSLIPDMKLDPQNGRLIVKGKVIDLQKLVGESEYVDIK